MANIPYQELKTYLEFVAQKYMDWANLQTSTDREGKQSKPFDMGLMVKTTQSKEKQEKGEQLPVLEGWFANLGCSLRNYEKKEGNKNLLPFLHFVSKKKLFNQPQNSLTSQAPQSPF